jgi:signal peptidase I
MPHPSSIARSRPRRFVERCIFLLTALLVMRTWYVEGLIVPCRIVGGSMAPSLVGLHRDIACADCGHRFVCAANVQPVSRRAVCPNCSYSGNRLEGEPDLEGDRLLIGKSVFRFRPPRRWEVVAFRRPQQAGTLHVKRVVGLPGESIQIRRGDVYVDGQIQRKSLSQQRALAVLVHNADRPPTIQPAPPPRWQSEKPNSQWGSADGRFAHPLTPDRAPIDWLVYQHWCCAADGQGKIREGPITDVCGYNQTLPRRNEETHRVVDLLLSLRLIEVSGRGVLVIRATDGAEQFRVRIIPFENRYEVMQNGRPIATPTAVGKLPAFGEGLTLEVSLFDRQFLLAFDGRTVVTWPYDRPQQPSEPSLRPLAVGVQGLEVVVEQLRLYRDVYYTHPIGLRGRWGLDRPIRLADDQYYVLGDNSPISEDSRTWPEGPGVAAKLLVGKPLLVHFPARVVSLGPWRFQVPDPAKIRYIR